MVVVIVLVSIHSATSNCILERDRWGVEGSASSKLTETVVWLARGVLRLGSMVADWVNGGVLTMGAVTRIETLGV